MILLVQVFHELVNSCYRIAVTAHNNYAVLIELFQTPTCPFDCFRLMREKRFKYIQVLLIFSYMVFGFQQTDNFVRTFQIAVVGNKVKKIPIFKARIGERNSVA